MGQGRNRLGIAGLVALLVLPAGGAAPVNVTVQPDVGPWLRLLMPTVPGGSASVADGDIHLQALAAEVVAPAGAVRVEVPWSFAQSTALPAGYWRQAHLQVWVVEDGVVLGYEQVTRAYTGATWSEAGTLRLEVPLQGVEVRHEMFVHLYASYYSSYPYRTTSEQAVGAVVATGLPAPFTERITTSPLLRGPQVEAVDRRTASFQAQLDVQANFTVVDTALAPDRFVVLQVPYRFLRETSRAGWGWESGQAYAYAHDQDGRFLGSAGAGWYRDHPCCQDPLAVDLGGNLSLPIEFRSGAAVRREVFVQVYASWSGYLCASGTGCAPFGQGASDHGLGGLVYTLPAEAPDLSPNGLAREVLGLL